MNIRLYKLFGLSIFNHSKSIPKKNLPKKQINPSYSPEKHIKYIPFIKDYPIDITGETYVPKK